MVGGCREGEELAPICRPMRWVPRVSAILLFVFDDFYASLYGTARLTIKSHLARDRIPYQPGYYLQSFLENGMSSVFCAVYTLVLGHWFAGFQSQR